MLLEVMISFALVVLCALPLIYPHTFILRAQKEFIQEIELDHYVNIHYAELVESLYKNQVSWDVVSGKSTLPLKPPKLPYTGTLRFEEKKQKQDSDNPSYTVFLFEITYDFDKFKYVYHLMLVRDLPAENVDENPEEIGGDGDE